MSRRTKVSRETSLHRYVPGPGLVTVLTVIKVTHRPGCTCGWQAATPYSTSQVAHAAWEAHVNRDEGNQP